MDQKFASIETLYFRFFDQRKGPEEALPNQFHVARQRLGVLRRAGLIHTEKVYSESKSLYLLSAVGFRYLETKKPDDAYAPPVKCVDFRSYEHDQALNYCRVAIERGGKSWKWLPERRIRMNGFSVSGVSQKLPASLVPDGIFMSSKGERVAFEFEASHRKKSRYEWKISEYQKVMGGVEPLLHQVLFVAGTPRIYLDLKSVLAGKKGFLLETYTYFLGKLFPSQEESPVLKSGGGE